MSLHPPLVPKRGDTLIVVAVARISRETQDVRSLDDLDVLLREYISSNYDGKVQWNVIAGRGSGEKLDRHEFLELDERIGRSDIDLVICEDIGRICRRVHAHLLCEHCEDNNTRLIALGDHLDTGRADWRLHSYFAVMRHEAYNADTAGRIRRSHRNRFMQGGMVQFVIFGYEKPPGAKHDSELRKKAEAEPVFDEWFRQLEDGATYSEVADWLNASGVPTGQYCQSPQWNGHLVRNVTFNPIVKGVRVRNRRRARRINKTAHRRSIDADPSELLQRDCPHLAFITPERYDRVIRLLELRNA